MAFSLSARTWLQEQSFDQRIWVAPAAAREHGPLLEAVAGELGLPVARLRVDASQTLSPGVVVLAPEDMQGPERYEVLAATRRCAPGRPILWGGMRDRDVLMDGINNWRVLRALPDDAGETLIQRAIVAGLERLHLDLGLSAGAEALEAENRSLAERIEELQRTRERLLHTARLETIGSMARQLAESCQGHLAAVEALAVLGDVVRDDEELSLCLDYSLSAVATSREMFDSLGQLGRDGEATVEVQEASLDTLVRRAAEFARFDKSLRARAMAIELQSQATVRIDEVGLWRVLMNLLRNAVQATGPGDAITVRTYATEGSAWVEVEDSGVGMAPDILTRVFDPFFTTRGEGGTGIGLNVSRTSVARFGGELTATSVLGGGSTFRIRLPLVNM